MNFQHLQLKPGAPIKTALLGAGVTGASVVNFYRRNNIELTVFDSKLTEQQADVKASELNIENIKTGEFSVDSLKHFDEIIVSPGIPTRHTVLAVLQQQGVSLVSDIEVFSRYCQKPVILVTGSNGKSSVASLIGLMAVKSGVKVAVGGNLDVAYQLKWGVPALDLLSQDVDLFVLEVSSFQLELTFNLQSAVAVLLNVTPDHMDYYPSLLDYHQAKQRVFNNSAIQIYNADDALTFPIVENNAERTSFTTHNPQSKQWGILKISDTNYLARGCEILIDCTELNIQGTHHYANALAALAVADCLNWNKSSCLNALKQFTGLPHRNQVVSQRFGVKWVNDSKATNVASSIASIISADTQGSLHLIFGGESKNQDFSALLPILEKFAVTVLVIGKNYFEFKSLFANLKKSIDVVYCVLLERAIVIARRLSKAGDTVLLSPACASRDQFRNYKHRGQSFEKLIEALP